MFGLNKVAVSDLFILDTILEQTPINSSAVTMSIIALFVLYVFKNKLTRFQFFANIAVLTAVVVTILISKIMNYQGPIVGTIPEGLPSFSLRSIDIAPDLVFMFIIHTVIISFVGFMEAIAIARQLEQKEPSKNSNGVELYKYPTPVNSNQELFGQGLGNIASSISGSYPVSGSFSRSAVNESVSIIVLFLNLISYIFLTLLVKFLSPPRIILV